MQLAVGHMLLLNKPFRAQESVPGEIARVTLPADACWRTCSFSEICGEIRERKLFVRDQSESHIDGE